MRALGRSAAISPRRGEGASPAVRAGVRAHGAGAALRRVAPIGLVVLLAAASAAAPPDARRAQLAPDLLERIAQAAPDEPIAVALVLREDALPPAAIGAPRRDAVRAAQQRVLDALPATGYTLARRYENLAGLALRATPAVLHALERRPDVERIYLDGRVRASLVEGRALTGADAAVAAGYSGAGIAVAVLDTGVDTDHPDLVDDLVAERCFCAGSPNPFSGCCPGGGDSQSGAGAAEDDAGHGTSVAGIVTSSGAVAPAGVAPDAGIVAVKVLDQGGSGSFSDIAAGLDWVLSNHVALGIRVVNLSLGDGAEYSSAIAGPCAGTNTANAIANLEAAGVAVFVASGNEAHTDGISFPACVAEAISVGGVYDASFGSVSWCGTTCATILCTDTAVAADDFVCHTNSDELLDLLAPDYRTRTSARGGGIESYFGGTSAASPYAAALAALLIERDTVLTPAALRTLMTTHGPLVLNPANGLLHPRTDVAALFLCGNGAVDPGEDCDDGGNLDGDCCSATCAFEPPASPCDDGDVCTNGDGCDGFGSCVPGPPVVCDDGVFCNGAETCDGVAGCQAGLPPVVDDGIACTVDACDEVADAVTHTPDDGACDDGAFCNGAEACDTVTGCEAGVPPTLDDGIACTIDGCDEGADAVTHTPDDGACDDGAFCNGVETCDVLGGCSAGAPPPLDDGVDCTADTCDEEADVVVHTTDPGLCDDGDPCTAEACDALLGCSHEPIPQCGVAVPVVGPSLGWLVAAVLAGTGFLGLHGLRRRSARRRG